MKIFRLHWGRNTCHLKKNILLAVACRNVGTFLSITTPQALCLSEAKGHNLPSLGKTSWENKRPQSDKWELRHLKSVFIFPLSTA